MQTIGVPPSLPCPVCLSVSVLSCPKGRLGAHRCPSQPGGAVLAGALPLTRTALSVSFPPQGRWGPGGVYGGGGGRFYVVCVVGGGIDVKKKKKTKNEQQQKTDTKSPHNLLSFSNSLLSHGRAPGPSGAAN